VKEEAKESEVNPQVKGEDSPDAARLGASPHDEEVATATAVIVKPTHFCGGAALLGRFGRDPCSLLPKARTILLSASAAATRMASARRESTLGAGFLYKSVEVGREIPRTSIRPWRKCWPISSPHQTRGQGIPGAALNASKDSLYKARNTSIYIRYAWGLPVMTQFIRAGTDAAESGPAA